MKRFATTFGILGAAMLAMALGSFSKPFDTKYNVKAGSNLAKAKCGVCHDAKGMKLNGYGQDMKTALEAAKTKKLTPEILAKLEGLDSDKDGMKNVDEIKADRMPGVKG